MRTILECRVCGSKDLTEVLSLGDLHLSAFLDPGSPPPPKYPLTLVLCSRCKLVQLRHTVPAQEMYEQYWYKSGTNQSMTEELQGIAKAASSFLRPGDDVLDIGCNDGTLLRAYPPGTFTVGFEPARNLIEHASEGGVDLVINDFFGAAACCRADLKPFKVVTSIAMFYDLDDPNSFVRDVYEVLADDGVWIIQMADLKSMIEQTMWDNICHEHLEYYSLAALECLLGRHGFAVNTIETNKVNGGSIRVYVVKKGHETVQRSVEEFRQAEAALALDTLAPYEAFAERVKEGNEQLNAFIRNAVVAGHTVCVYGASTKGNTLLQSTGLGYPLIKAAAERNPDKWGKVTVGTNIPIMSEEDVRALKPDYMLVLPWHFLDEFVEREAEYLKSGGAFIVPLPGLKIVRAQNGV